MGIVRSFNRYILVNAVMLSALSGLPATVQAQGYGQSPALGAGGAGGTGQGSRFPFRVKLSGTLNPTALNENSIKVATLSISGYRETYQFEIMQAEAVDDKQIMRAAIVSRIAAEDYDYLVVGTKELLSKIGQSVPNTPITITAFLRQRKRELILESVETISVDVLSSPERPESRAPPPTSSSDAIQPEQQEPSSRSE